MPDLRSGFLFGLAAYVLWGLFPLYWKLLDSSGALELLAHRLLWSLVTIAALVLVRRRFGQLRLIMADPRRRWPLVAASVLVSVNWGAYIWGVNHDRVVETSLGYFVTPLLAVLLGVVVLHERLRVMQWIAVGIAFLAVAVLTVENGRPPWIAIVLALSWGFYGLAKKKARAGAIEGMALESATMAPVALVFLAVLAARGQSTVTDHGSGYLALVLLTGPITAVPLLLFGAAATRISLTTLGLLNYVGPVMQFVIGVLVFHEHMSSLRWAGFALVWVALVILTWDGLARRRRALVPAAVASAV